MLYAPGTTEYVNAHQYVRKVRGEPDVCVACGGCAVDWASISGQHDDPEDYQPMCKSCHVSLDRRRAHDEREDHPWTAEANPIRCGVCRRRSRRAEYRRIKRDPVRYKRRLEQNRKAVRRYREAQGC